MRIVDYGLSVMIVNAVCHSIKKSSFHSRLRDL